MSLKRELGALRREIEALVPDPEATRRDQEAAHERFMTMIHRKCQDYDGSFLSYACHFVPASEFAATLRAHMNEGVDPRDSDPRFDANRRYLGEPWRAA